MKRGVKIIHNRVKCKECGEIIESRTIHDFVGCKCFMVTNGTEGIAVDGGTEYMRRVGDLDSYIDVSETRPFTDKEVDEYNKRRMEYAEKYGWEVDLMEK